MPLPALFTTAISDYLSIRIADACVALLKLDTGHFATKYPNIRTIPPQIQDEALRIPDLVVQPVIERDLMNRLVGKLAKPLYHVRFVIYHDLKSFYPSNRTASDTIANELDRLDALLIQGSDGNNLGKLLDPTAAADSPSSVKYLNERIFGDPIRLPPEAFNINENKGEDAPPNWIVEYKVIVSFEAHVDAMTKARRTL